VRERRSPIVAGGTGRAHGRRHERTCGWHGRLNTKWLDRYDAAVADLMDFACSKRAIPELSEYFDEYRPHRYTGRRFETLDGGGDRPGVQT